MRHNTHFIKNDSHLSMDFSEQDQGYGRKLIGVSVVVLIHALVIYALFNGLGKQLINVIREVPIQTQIIEEVKFAPPPPPVIQPKPQKIITPPRPFVPKPEVQVRETPTPNAIQAVTNVPPPPSEVSTAPATSQANGPVVVSPVVDFTTCDKPDYPRSSLRNEEQGTVRIQFLIGVDGRVADAKIDKSSGFRTLDSAAKNALRLCKFKPGTIDGKPQQSWTVVNYVWKLPD